MHSRKNYIILILSLTTIAGAAIAWNQYLELIQLRAAALTTDERADWMKRLWATEKRRTELESQLTSLQQRNPVHADASIEDPLSEEGPTGRRGGPGNFMAAMDRPEVQRLVSVQQRAALDARYSALFKSLALSPAQLDKLKDLLVEKRTSMIDVMAAAREQGVNPRRNPDAFSQLVATAQDDIDANIRSTLGETGFAQYQNYEKTLPQRNVVDQLEQRLSYSSTPLTPQQSTQMIALLAATAPASASNGNVTANGIGTVLGLNSNGSRITDKAVNQSLGVLAAPQIEALVQLQKEQQAQAALTAAMRNRPRPAGATNGSSASSPAQSGTTPPVIPRTGG